VMNSLTDDDTRLNNITCAQQGTNSEMPYLSRTSTTASQTTHQFTLNIDTITSSAVD